MNENEPIFFKNRWNRKLYLVVCSKYKIEIADCNIGSL